MKKLILIRHAKSSWDAPLIDKDRPLSARGINDAHLMAANIEQYLPESYIVWSSTAQRTKNTAYIFAETLFIPQDTIVFKDDLYTFDEKALERVIKSCDNQYDNLILFGHNDAITNFVNIFGNQEVENVPTSGFVYLTFNEAEWKDIKKGKTEKLLFPRDFKKHDSPLTGKQVY
ncbi:histidine phosphatase family protein [Flavobacterium arcticum]|uniref:Histidine phosphatase family protein n=1 Tax=Flavobacterium arcticum TaxID=1784713 RepID=A0A345HCY2_9FLAO|nr:histidine phosphatase family protein [Flavobacterium arcticum]AXG74442.1 histidine phosphatase family protein [Flavobacterium arcticum]KAF2512437.1 histidine phosphatase family protein [Flavobacterium arcticum]